MIVTVLLSAEQNPPPQFLCARATHGPCLDAPAAASANAPLPARGHPRPGRGIGDGWIGFTYRRTECFGSDRPALTPAPQR
jgi:hypothetical protein